MKGQVHEAEQELACVGRVYEDWAFVEFRACSPDQKAPSGRLNEQATQSREIEPPPQGKKDSLE
jgi:hypothetical protein